jgi:hypothetical protein
MTKDMFDESLLENSPRGASSLIAKTIVHSLLSQEQIGDSSNIEAILPKVSFIHDDHGVFILQTLSHHLKSASKFIHEFIHSEVETVSALEVESFCSFPFRFFELDTKKYLVTETLISVTDTAMIERCYTVVKQIQKQILLGLRSSFYARMVLEMKGQSLEGKSSYVQERIMSYIHRFPKLFDYDLIPLMNQFMTDAKEEFTKNRSIKDLSKIIVTFYHIYKKLSHKSKIRGGAREIFTKSSTLFIEELFGRKKVISIVVGISHLYENERLEKEHLIKACKALIKGATVIEHSFLKIFAKGEGGYLFYIELEKREGAISFQEIKSLKESLKKNIESHIQKFARKMFMPQNTEEVIKYTVALSKELGSKEDLPQVAVLFDSQSNDNLLFTAIVVKVSGKCSPFELFEKGEGRGYSCKIKQVRILGEFKEGIELSYSMKVSSFMREDYSIDIYRARAKIIWDLQKRLGEIRDYNGGMLEKQGDVLSLCQGILRKKGVKNSVLVENFFYAIHPSEIRAMISIDQFIEFFTPFYELFTYKTSKDTFLHIRDGRILFLARVKTERKKEAFLNEIKHFESTIGGLIFFSLSIQEKFYIGVHFKFQDEETKELFLGKMSLCLKL